MSKDTRPRITVVMNDADLVNRVKNAVYWTPGETMSSITARGLEYAVTDLEMSHNDGKPFPQRDTELKGGRPMS